MAEILVPKLNANDTAYVLLGWLAPDGAAVVEGAPVAEIETSKAVEEIPAPSNGFLRHAAHVGADISPGQLLATIASSLSAPAVDGGPTAPDAAAGPLITAPARARMAELGVTDDQVRALGVKVVRSTDIDALVAPSPPGHALSKGQQAVGRAVSRSHATIPAAYSVTKIDVGAALTRAKSLIRQVRQPVGLANMFIEAVAALHARFPLFYSELAMDGTSVLLADAPHIGVTVDVGQGLYVPVIRDAAARTPGEIAQRLTEIREHAAAGTFRAIDLDGANIGVTLHTDHDVVLAIPLIFPGQVCALAITAPQAEVVLAGDGTLSNRSVSYIGLAYDHRVINGRDAALYLDALKSALQ